MTKREKFWVEVKKHKWHGQAAPKGWFRVKTFDYLSLTYTLLDFHVAYRIRDGYASGACVVTFKEPTD